MKKVIPAIGALLCGLSLAGGASAQIEMRPAITMAGAEAAINACLTLAQQRGWRMNVWVYDSTGEPIAFKRMDGASLFGRNSARQRAWTASQAATPTSGYGNFQPLVLDMLNIFPTAGGFPVVIDGQVAGGIGVGGSGGAADEECAIAAADAVLRAAGKPIWRPPAPQEGRGGAGGQGQGQGGGGGRGAQ
jgi:uncharacterized protein GlcG (DUF336 family)